MKNMSNVSPRSANRGRVSSAAPTITSMRSATPARSKFMRATSACRLFEFEGDDVSVGADATGQVDGAVAGQRADLQHALGIGHPRQERQQPAVLSRHFDRRHVGRRSGFPRGAQRVVLGVQNAGEQLVEGFGVRLGHRPDVTPLAHAFLGVDDPQHMGDLGTHYRRGEIAERRDELGAVRRVGVAEMVGDLVQHDEFA